MAKWCLLLPPSGAARQSAQHMCDAFHRVLSPSDITIFDTGKYLCAFNGMLKKPDDTMSADLMNQSLIVHCLQYATTHLFVPALCPVTLFSLDLLQKQGVTTMHWFMEDYRRATYWKDVLPGYNYFFAVQKGLLRQACEKSGCTYLYLPNAASPYYRSVARHPSDQPPSVDAAFIGLPSSYRARLLEYLHSRTITLAIAGEGWGSYSGPLTKSIITTSWVGEEAAAQIMQNASVSLNLSFHEPLSDNGETQLSPRVFDILSLDTILLTEDVALLKETIGDCYYETFSDNETAAQIIIGLRSGRQDKTLVKKIQDNHAGINRNHTWENRVRSILDCCACQ